MGRRRCSLKGTPKAPLLGAPNIFLFIYILYIYILYIFFYFRRCPNFFFLIFFYRRRRRRSHGWREKPRPRRVFREYNLKCVRQSCTGAALWWWLSGVYFIRLFSVKNSCTNHDFVIGTRLFFSESRLFLYRNESRDSFQPIARFVHLKFGTKIVHVERPYVCNVSSKNIVNNIDI